MKVLAILIALAGVAHADPTFAIDLRSQDKLADKMTEQLEAALRTAAIHYKAKGSHADRVAASTDDCPSARPPACAKEIGTKLGVDYIFAGDIQTRGSRFELSLDVIEVSSKRRVRSLRDVTPTSTRATKWAKQLFERITEKETGTLGISCNVSRAEVMIDGQHDADLYQKRATLTGLALGRHAIEIRAPGYKPYTGDVIIDGATELDVLLDQ